MRQFAALVLILLVLICPYNCVGSPFQSKCGDACCPPQDTDSPATPQPAPDRCDGSCASCLCGGAVMGNESLGDSHVPAYATFEFDPPPCLANRAGAPMDDASSSGPAGTSAARSGAALRALYQTFLL